MLSTTTRVKESFFSQSIVILISITRTDTKYEVVTAIIMEDNARKDPSKDVSTKEAEHPAFVLWESRNQTNQVCLLQQGGNIPQVERKKNQHRQHHWWKKRRKNHYMRLYYHMFHQDDMMHQRLKFQSMHITHYKH